jgi:hypothetical protein
MRRHSPAGPRLATKVRPGACAAQREALGQPGGIGTKRRRGFQQNMAARVAFEHNACRTQPTLRKGFLPLIPAGPCARRRPQQSLPARAASPAANRPPDAPSHSVHGPISQAGILQSCIVTPVIDDRD